LYNECAKRLGISYNELVSMRFEELKESLEKKKSVIDKKILDERFEDHALIFYGDKSFVLSGKELEEFNEKDENINEDIKEFKGNIGFKSGIIKGKVRILTYTEQISSFKEGEILVTPMTNPSFVPAMRKAAAIITDDGGLLCHAAIVSREMKKPCIIGTKIATQVLKDGDLVEVDAEKGIVKILERKK
jgi:pyruvate,water dikinase